jgi:hypothetical protein
MVKLNKKIKFLKASLNKREKELVEATKTAIDGILEENGLSCGVVVNKQNICQIMSLLLENDNKPIKIKFDIWKENS